MVSGQEEIAWPNWLPMLKGSRQTFKMMRTSMLFIWTLATHSTILLHKPQNIGIKVSSFIIETVYLGDHNFISNKGNLITFFVIERYCSVEL